MLGLQDRPTVWRKFNTLHRKGVITNHRKIAFILNFYVKHALEEFNFQWSPMMPAAPELAKAGETLWLS